MSKGRIVQILGPVVDIEFDHGHLPDILNAVKIEGQSGSKTLSLTVEVAQHLGDNLVRAVAMSSTDGLVRGMDAIDLGGPITVPVGPATLGRVFNVLGDPIDGAAAPDRTLANPIHRQAPSFEELSTQTEMLETGIKVVDLLAPYTDRKSVV